jgi:hypothetical protein
MSTDRPLTKGYLARIIDGAIQNYFEFQYNPTEFSRQRSVEYGWLGSAGSAVPEAVFSKISKEEMTLSLFLDATRKFSSEKEGINSQLAALELFTWPDPDSVSVDIGQVQAPPQVLFGLGNYSARVVVERFSSNITRWNRSLVPTRATVELGLGVTFVDMANIRERLDRLKSLASQAMVEAVR